MKPQDKTGTYIFLPHDAVSDSGVMAYQVRTNSKVTHTIGMFSILCNRFGGDKTMLNLSYTTSYRSRIAVVDNKYAEIIHEGWVCPKPTAF